MKVIECELKDIPRLAQLNRELYEDENNDKIPVIDVIEERLTSALNNDSKAFWFINIDEIIGYALVKTKVSPYYLSHFYICREQRRNHLGTDAFNNLLKTLGIASMDLDVFVWNSRGQAFWKSLGFEERCIIMRKS